MKINPTKSTLSIITVCRNEAGRIQRTIDSLVLQSDCEYEWIIVDGASTDGTLDLLRRHQPSISQIISEPDNGLYDAMNKGIRAATGEFILFMNAGDTFENRDVVSSFREEAFDADLVVGDVRVLFPDGREQYRESSEKNLDSVLLYWRSLPHQATFIRRTLFEKYGLYDISFKIAADWEFFARVIMRHHVPITAWSHCMAVYTNDGISARLENRKQLRQERYRIRHMHYPAIYRWRRDFNEAWGALLHRIRQQVGKQEPS